jgi:2-keto-4-pentenoate hydratase
VQRALVARLPGTLVGFELGFTSPAMRQQFGVEHPNFGRLFDWMAIDQDTVGFDRFIHPRVEAEIAVRLSRAVAWPVDRTALRDAVAAVAPALEIVDSRYQDYRFRPLENTADNSSAAAFRLGPAHHPEVLSALSASRVHLYRNGQLIDEGALANLAQDPLDLIGRLAERLAREGRAIPAHAVVLTGGLTRAHPAPSGDRFRADFGPLGAVELVFR